MSTLPRARGTYIPNDEIRISSFVTIASIDEYNVFQNNHTKANSATLPNPTQTPKKKPSICPYRYHNAPWCTRPQRHWGVRPSGRLATSRTGASRCPCRVLGSTWCFRGCLCGCVRGHANVQCDLLRRWCGIGRCSHDVAWDGAYLEASPRRACECGCRPARRISSRRFARLGFRRCF